MISNIGAAHVKAFPDEQLRGAQMTHNMKWLGSLIRSSVFGNQRPVPVREVEDGLLHMLKNDDSSMWPVVRQHTSLLPMFNRVHCLLALHDELLYVVAPVDLNGYWRILGQLDFPSNWHSVISQNRYVLYLIVAWIC